MSEIIKIETIAQLHQMLEIGKTKHPLISVIHFEEPLSKEKFSDVRVVPGWYCIALKEFACTPMGYGRNSYDFEDGSMIFTSPNQVLSLGEQSENEEKAGWSIFFHPDLIRKWHLGKTIEAGIREPEQVQQIVRELITEQLLRPEGIRLLGVGISNFMEERQEPQLTLSF